MNWILALTTAVLFGCGLFHLLQRDGVRLVLGFSLVFSAVNLFLLRCGTFDGTAAPYAGEPGAAVDPLPQALVLTAVVIGFGVLSLLLSLVYTAATHFRSLDVDALDELRH